MSILLEEWIKMDGGMNEDDIPDCIASSTVPNLLPNTLVNSVENRDASSGLYESTNNS